MKRQESEKGTLYLGRIPHGFYEDEMKEYFSQFGDVSRLRLARNRKVSQRLPPKLDLCEHLTRGHHRQGHRNITRTSRCRRVWRRSWRIRWTTTSSWVISSNARSVPLPRPHPPSPPSSPSL